MIRKETFLPDTQPSGKNIFIEYLRFLFAVMIVFHHFLGLDGVEKASYFLKNGNLAVEFFAVLSGYLMAKSLSCHVSSIDNSVFHNSTIFIYRKWRNIFVINAVSFLIVFIARQFVMPWKGVIQLLTRFTDNISEPLLLSTTGIKGVSMNYNGADWYLSSMFISMIVIVPICFWKPKLFKYYCFPVGIMLLGILMKLHGRVTATEENWSGVLCLGNLRIMSELLLGSASFFAACRFSRNESKNRKRTLLRSVAIIGWGVFVFCCHRGVSNETTPVIVIFVCILLSLSFVSFDTWRPGKQIEKIGLCLGKFSLLLYLNHRGWIFVIKNMKLDIPSEMQILLCIVVSVVSAYVVSCICKKIIAFLSTKVAIE